MNHVYAMFRHAIHYMVSLASAGAKRERFPFHTCILIALVIPFLIYNVVYSEQTALSFALKLFNGVCSYPSRQSDPMLNLVLGSRQPDPTRGLATAVNK